MEEKKEIDKVELIRHFCCGDNLSTYDPYDIWKSNLGVWVKQLYFKNKLLGLVPAGLCTIYDYYLNNKTRFLYIKQEYPVVRAQACLALINLYKKEQRPEYLENAKTHINWLLDNYSKGYSGHCWGTGFKIVISKDLIYNENTPFSTNTPYILEALHEYYKLTLDSSIKDVIRSIYLFYEKDLIVLKEDSNQLITSYGPFKDRIVTNAVSYTMFAYSIFLDYLDEKGYIETKIQKLYSFLKSVQLERGEWMYSPYDKHSFIDCFHSCFVLKNIYKTNRRVQLPDADLVIERGYSFINESFFDKKTGLFKRFALSNKPSLVKFDLYDNSEVLNLSKLLNDNNLSCHLEKRIVNSFVKNMRIYSVIEFLGFRKNKNTLRWASMPFLLAISEG